MLHREGADFVVAVVHADRRQDYLLMAARTIELVLTGHDHDLFINYDGRTAMVESSYDAQYVTIVDVAIDVKTDGSNRTVSWWPQFRVIDTATVTPDPEVAAAVAGFEQILTRELDVPLATTATELDSRNVTVRTREAAIGNLIADAVRDDAHADVAILNGGGIRGSKIYAPGDTISRRDVLNELPFGNRAVTLRNQWRRAAARHRERALDAAGCERAFPASLRANRRGGCQPPRGTPRQHDPDRRPAAG